ncbi:MAG TPA: hypothetical protein VJK54_10180, partial [Chthoniobacterales bacterium]|nr:hypothetical protein [Chthoniobacterales bacterium]
AADQWKLSAERYSVGKENEGVTLGFEGKSLQKKSDYQAKAAEAQEAGQTMLTEGYREAAQISQRAADQWKLSAQTKAAGRESEGVNWGWEGTSLQAKADYHAKAAEVQEAEKITLAEGYREAAATSQRAADQYKLEAQSKALGKESEGRSWGWEGSSLQAKADYQAKAAEAQDAGKTMLAEGYREAAATSQRAADQWKLSAQTKAAGRESEGVSWGWEGTSLQAKADYQAKAATAQEAGRSMLAEGYREAAEISQRAADQWKLSAERYSVGKENEGVTLGFEGKSLQKKSDYQAKAAEAQEAGKTMLAEGYREAAQISQGAADQWKLSAQTKAAGRESEGVNWGWEGTSLQAKADCQAKAAEAQEAGKIMIAEGYREAAQISQRAADEWKLSAERHSVGKESEGVNWGWEGTSLQAKADYQAKAAEAQEAGKVQLAEGYREAAEILQHAIEELKQSVLAKVLGTDEDNCWYNAGCERYKGAEKLGKAIIAEAAGESKVAQAWREAAKQNYLSVDSYTKAATIFATGKLNRTLFNRAYSDADSVTEVTGQFLAEDEEINNSNAEGCRWYFAGKGYYNAAGKIEQAIQAEASGNSKLAQAWNKVAEISQFSSESYTKGAIAYAQRKTDEANSWNNAGYIYELAAEQLNKAIETRERKNTDLAEKHQQAAEKLEQAANLMKRFAETDADNNGTERIRLYQEVKTIINVLIQSSASF